MSRTMLQLYDLPTIFRKVEDGAIRIPAFQRLFIWNKQQILKLIESIHKGFPIGMFVFLDAFEKMFETADSALTGLPQAPERYPTLYVIDGVQRLLSLYNCFHWQKTEDVSEFNIVFDLDAGRFLHYKKRGMPENYIHLSSIFTSKFFSDIKSSPNDAHDYYKLMSAATDLHKGLQTYEISAMVMRSDNLNEILSIYESLNNTGTKLTMEDIKRVQSLRGS